MTIPLKAVKMTEEIAVYEGLGSVPKGWGVVRLGSIASIRSGGTPSTSQKKYWDGAVPWCTPTDITALAGRKYLYDTSRTITEAGLDNSSAEWIPSRSVIMTSRATIGECAINSQPITTNQGFKNLIPHSPIDAEFLYYRMVTEKERLISLCGGSTFLEIGKAQLSSFEVLVPKNKEEQKVIAKALSDADELIEGLEALIAKKRAIRQGAMQDLLAPKKKWLECRLGDVAQLKARIGWQGLTTAEYLDSGDYTLVTGTDFKDGFIDWDNCHFVDRHRYDQDKYIQLRENDVLVTKDGTIGKIAFIDDLPRPATLNSGVFVIRSLNSTFRPQFLYYLLMSHVFEDFLAKLSAGSTISHLYQKDFVNFSFLIPPTAAEQDEISSALLDMDHEVRVLETRLSKARQVKQGMMQDLLTGRVRLV